MSKPPQLEQFSANYDPTQDRLPLRVRTSDDTEFRFWLTRRYVALLWPILKKMAEDFSARKAPGDPLLRHTLAELAHGEAVGKGDFGSAYRHGSIFPLGEEPVLLARITVKPLTGDSHTLTLLPQHGEGIHLELNEKLVHVLACLLRQTAAAAEWSLALDIAAGAELAFAPPAARHTTPAALNAVPPAPTFAGAAPVPSLHADVQSVISLPRISSSWMIC